ncbi:MAG: hypothetical protein H6Q55_2761 [Deltaproteobacteria bacterium]|nr:hypothetical protein [Deltaproteobacteria bacterium]
MRVRWTADRWIAIGLIVLTGCYMVMAWRLPRFKMTTVIDAHVFPMVLGVVQLLLAAWLCLKPGQAAGERSQSPWKGLNLSRGGILLLLCLVYIGVMSRLGFVISTFGFLTATPFVLGWRRWKVSCLVALVVAFGIYFLFTMVLGVVIPKGIMPF